MKDDRRYWLDEKRNVDKVVYALYAVCALLVVADFFYEKHVHLGFERWIGFYGWYGFVACVLLVLAAKGLRVLLKRDEDYYDR
jgi:hypothetical protein